MIVMEILAQAARPTGGAQNPGLIQFLTSPMFPMLLVFIVIYYMFLIRPKQTQEKQKRDMLTKIKRGDRVQTIGGILGTIVEARDGDVVVKVDEGNNTKIKFARSAIAAVLSEEKAEAK